MVDLPLCLTAEAQYILAVNLVTKDFCSLASFSQWLITERGMGPSTCINYLNDCLVMANFVVLFFRPSEWPNMHARRMEEQSSLIGIYNVCNKLKRNLSLRDRHLRATERLSIPTLVSNQRAPKGGLQELINVVMKAYNEWFRPLVRRFEHAGRDGTGLHFHTKDIFNAVIKLLLATSKYYCV